MQRVLAQRPKEKDLHLQKDSGIYCKTSAAIRLDSKAFLGYPPVCV